MERILSITVPEALFSKIELLAQIEQRNIDEIIIELMETYTNHSVSKLQAKQEVRTLGTKKGEITLEMIEIAYSVAKDVLEQRISRTDGKRKIHQLSGMNEGSAQDYISNFLAMMSGETYMRTLSTKGTEYILRNIYNDYGKDRFALAVKATRNHLAYYENISPSKTKSQKRATLLDKLEDELL